MTDGQEFNVNAKVTYEFAGRTYIIDVNEYGAADVSCHFGRGVEWHRKVRPNKTFRESWAATPAFSLMLDEHWVTRIDAAINDMRGLVLPDVEYGTGDGKSYL